MSIAEHRSNVTHATVRNMKRDKLETVAVMMADQCEKLYQELRQAKNGEVFLAGDMSEFAMIAKPVLEWDCLTAMTFLPGNKQYGYAGNAEDFRKEATKTLIVKGELPPVGHPKLKVEI